MVVHVGMSTVSSHVEEEGQGDVCSRDSEEAVRSRRRYKLQHHDMPNADLDTHNSARPKIRMMAPKAFVVPVLLPNPIPVMATATIQKTVSIQLRME
jgi:hypothetical protein